MSPEFRNRIIRPETKAAIAPTERSSPPPVMTSVCPTAIVAMNVLRVSTLEMIVEAQEARVDDAAENAEQRERDETARPPRH